jgi:ABC-type antimicrobial peptide transport system permease subunit
MLRRIAVLALLLGILPAVSHALPRALPRAPGPDAPAAVHLAESWLAHLGHLLESTWTRVTENTGMSIDPDGQPQSPPEDPGPDTGMSIDPNG